MEQQLKNIEMRLGVLEKKVDDTFVVVEKMRKYFLWTLIITLVLVVAPLLFLPFAIGSFLKTFSGSIGL